MIRGGPIQFNLIRCRHFKSVLRHGAPTSVGQAAKLRSAFYVAPPTGAPSPGLTCYHQRKHFANTARLKKDAWRRLPHGPRTVDPKPVLSGSSRATAARQHRRARPSAYGNWEDESLAALEVCYSARGQRSSKAVYWVRALPRTGTARCHLRCCCNREEYIQHNQS